jgi:hypothetical protein
MIHTALLVLSSSIILSTLAVESVNFTFTPQFLQTPTKQPHHGNGHGEIAVDSQGLIYISINSSPDKMGMNVYNKDGSFLKKLPLPLTIHGFSIRKQGDQEFIFATIITEQRLIKATLDGNIVMEIPTTSFPAEHMGELETPKGSGKMVKAFKFTNCDVASNGDIYIVDGYGIDNIFIFDQSGKYKKTIIGRTAPLNLNNAHKIFIDKRYSPERLMVCDRLNNRMIHLDLDGNFIQVIADQNLRRPSSASFHGDLMCVAEIQGRISVWNKENKMVAELGLNTNDQQTNTPLVDPKDWQEGIVTSPHGVTFDQEGNILETEWNKFGRVLRWKKS